MIPFVPLKISNHATTYLKMSSDHNKFTNFGPLTRMLEGRISKKLPDGLSATACSSGSAALHALGGLVNIIAGARKWVTSSFSFPCTQQGPFRDARIVDCSDSGRFNYDTDETPIVTNLFGRTEDLPDGLHILDSAFVLTGPVSPFTAFSFHHTKPWGFGEGGFAVCPTEHKQLLEAVINFGIGLGDDKKWGFNGKMSEVSAAYILARLDQYQPQEYIDQATRLAELANSCKLTPLSCKHASAFLPIMYPKPTQDKTDLFVSKKYYYPLCDTPGATQMYERIICIPCHDGMNKISNQQVVDQLQMLARQS